MSERSPQSLSNLVSGPLVVILALLGVGIITGSHLLFVRESILGEVLSALGTAVLVLAVIESFFKPRLERMMTDPELVRLKEAVDQNLAQIAKFIELMEQRQSDRRLQNIETRLTQLCEMMGMNFAALKSRNEYIANEVCKLRAGGPVPDDEVGESVPDDD